MKKNKNHRLLVQVSLVIVPLFLIMIASVSYVVYRSTVDSFLNAQNEYMTETLNQSYDNLVVVKDGFYFDYWEQHPDLPEAALNNVELSSLQDQFIENGVWSGEWLKQQSEAVQSYCAKQMYLLSQTIHDIDTGDKNYDSLFLIDVNEPNEGFVFLEFSKSESLTLGDRVELNISDHPALETIVSQTSERIEFEKTSDFFGKGSRYIGYKSIVVDGRVRAVFGLSYNWSDFQDMMSQTLRQALTIGIGGLLVLMLGVLLLLYRLALKPVGRIQKTVREYIETKDSEKVEKALQEVQTNNEIGLLSDNFAELAREIDSYTAENIKLAGEKERVSAELDMARNIQASQLPRRFPAFPDRTEFDIYASMPPAKEVGGDFYDFFLVDEDHLALVIADVSDKGVPAALFMMMSRMLINSFTSMGMEPGEVLQRANEKLCENNEQKMFVTVWLGILEISTGKITAVNAGHEYPMIRQPDGSFELFKDKHGFVIGGVKKMKFRQYEFTLQKGGTLFVYTDGAAEATDANGEMFKTERLLESLNRSPDASPQELLETVRGDIDRFVGDAPQFDDLTMLSVKLNKENNNE